MPSERRVGPLSDTATRARAGEQLGRTPECVPRGCCPHGAERWGSGWGPQRGCGVVFSGYCEEVKRQDLVMNQEKKVWERVSGRTSRLDS